MLHPNATTSALVEKTAEPSRQDLSNSAQGPATLRTERTPPLNAVASSSLSCLPQPDHQNPAATAQTFALLDWPATAILGPAASCAAARIHQFGPLSLVSLALACARAAWRDQPPPAAVRHTSERAVRELSAQGPSNLGRRSATLLLLDRRLFDVLASEATHGRALCLRSET